MKLFENFKKVILNKSFNITSDDVDEFMDFLRSEYPNLKEDDKYFMDYKNDLISILQTPYSYNTDGVLIGIDGFPDTIKLYRIIDEHIDKINQNCLGVSCTYDKDLIRDSEFQGSVGFDSEKPYNVVEATFKREDLDKNVLLEILVRLQHERELRVHNKCAKPLGYIITPYELY